MTPIAIIRMRDVGKKYTREYPHIRKPLPKIVWLPRVVKLDDVDREVFRLSNGETVISDVKIKKNERTKHCLVCRTDKPIGEFKGKRYKRSDRTRSCMSYAPYCIACGYRNYRLSLAEKKVKRLHENVRRQFVIAESERFMLLPIGTQNNQGVSHERV